MKHQDQSPITQCPRCELRWLFTGTTFGGRQCTCGAMISVTRTANTIKRSGSGSRGSKGVSGQ